MALLAKWTESSAWNFSNKLYLLQAEHHRNKEENAKALDKYEAAINAARKHGFSHEEGLANEYAASFHLHQDSKEDALLHLTEAKSCYHRWGAVALVARLDDKIKGLL